MKNIKQVLAIILMLAMVTALVVVPATAAGDAPFKLELTEEEGVYKLSLITTEELALTNLEVVPSFAEGFTFNGTVDVTNFLSEDNCVVNEDSGIITCGVTRSKTIAANTAMAIWSLTAEALTPGSAYEFSVSFQAAGNNGTHLDFEGSSVSTTYNVPKLQAQFALSSATVKQGESASVTLTVTGGEVAAGVVQISAMKDSDSLTISSVELNTAISGAKNEGNGKISFGSETNLAADTMIATIVFATDADTPVGDYTVNMAAAEGQGLTNAANVLVEPEVTTGTVTVNPADLTVTFEPNNGEDPWTETVAYNTPVAKPSTDPTPATAGYKFVRWEKDGAEYDFTAPVTESFTLTAKYGAETYTATFVDESGATVATRTFTVDDESIEEPAVPAKDGYDGAWEPYTLGAADITIHPIYTAIEYSVIFKADGETVATVTWTVETSNFEEPAVPVKAGYDGAWEAYELGFDKFNADKTMTVNAVYTAKVYTVTPEVTPSQAKLVIKDSEGNVLTPDENGAYELTFGQNYTYEISLEGFTGVSGELTPSAETSVEAGYTWTVNADGTVTLTFDPLANEVGDVDGDGLVTVQDAQELYNYLVDLYDGEGYTESDGVITSSSDETFKFIIARGDVNGDNVTDYRDIVPMLNLISKINQG